MVVLLLAISWIDRYEKEPYRLLGLALIFGAVLAPLAAYGIEKALDITTSYTAQSLVPHYQLGIGTPLVEELMRGLAILAVFLLVRWEVDDLLDGIIYGAVVGIGFGAAANFVSIWSTHALPGVNTTPSLYTAAITAVNHAFYGAVIGLALGAARKAQFGVVVGAAVVGTGVAFLFHVLHDYLPWWVSTGTSSPDSNALRRIVTQIPNFLGIFILGLIALWAVGRERLLVARYLRDEVDRGTLTPDEYATVTNSFRRSGALWIALVSRGQRVWALRRQLDGLASELAFRKYHRQEDHIGSASREYLDEDVYRQQIAETRTRLVALDPSAAATKRSAPPSGPRTAFLAGIGSLVVFGLLVVAGVLIWVLALRPTSSNEVKSTSGTPAAALFSAPGAASSLAAVHREAAASASIGPVIVCRGGVSGGRCVGPAVGHNIRVSRRSRQIAVGVAFKGLPGGTIDMVYIDAGTRQQVGHFRFKLRGRTGIVGTSFRGPFKKATIVVGVFYNGTLIKPLVTAIRFV
jgi:RsiW-degrading membrane proteinase PrsW (M82 family)